MWACDGRLSYLTHKHPCAAVFVTGSELQSPNEDWKTQTCLHICGPPTLLSCEAGRRREAHTDRLPCHRHFTHSVSLNPHTTQRMVTSTGISQMRKLSRRGGECDTGYTAVPWPSQSAAKLTLWALLSPRGPACCPSRSRRWHFRHGLSRVQCCQKDGRPGRGIRLHVDETGPRLNIQSPGV